MKEYWGGELTYTVVRWGMFTASTLPPQSILPEPKGCVEIQRFSTVSCFDGELSTRRVEFDISSSVVWMSKIRPVKRTTESPLSLCLFPPFRSPSAVHTFTVLQDLQVKPKRPKKKGGREGRIYSVGAYVCICRGPWGPLYTPKYP